MNSRPAIRPAAGRIFLIDDRRKYNKKNNKAKKASLWNISMVFLKVVPLALTYWSA